MAPLLNVKERNFLPRRVDANEFENFSQNLVFSENLEVEDAQQRIDDDEANLETF
jgi:hypothetical protein